MDEIRGIKLQHSLGRIHEFYRLDMNMSGFMALARVDKVHHKSGTADITIVNTGDKFSSSENNEGRYSARILRTSAHYDSQRQRYWGTISPIAEGSLVLVAFLDNFKQRPVILGTFPRPYEYENHNPSIYPLNEKQPGFHRREALKTLRINPDLSYAKIDGEGNIEYSFGSRSFLAIYNTFMDDQGNLNDYHGGFDQSDLSEIDKRTGFSLVTDWEECKAPMKLLFVHRSNFYDPTTWTKFFINERGMLRVTRDNNDDRLSYLEVSETGEIKIRRQIDSPFHNEGGVFSEITIKEDGSIILKQADNGKLNEIIMNSNGKVTFKHRSGSKIEFNDDGDIIISAKRRVKISEGA